MRGNRNQYVSVDFDPRIVRGCGLWLDAADFSTFTLTGASKVTKWRDKSGTGTDASQNTVAYYPTYSNGQLVFDGNSTFLSIAPTIRPTNTFVVVKSDTTAPSGSNRHVYRKEAETLLRFSNTNIQSYWYTGAATCNITTYTGGATTNMMLIEAFWDGTTTRLFTNGIQRATASFSGTQFSGTTTTMRIGAEFTGTETSPPNTTTTWLGSINELIMYSNTPSTADRQAIEGYLAWKWGFQTDLCGANPYRWVEPTMRPVIPPDIAPCEHWFDAADVATISPDFGTTTAWAALCNKGSASASVLTNGGYLYASSAGPTFRTDWNGMNYIRMATSADTMIFYSTFSNQPRSRYMVIRPLVNTTNAVSPFLLYQNATAASGNDCITFSNNTLLQLAQGVAFRVQTNATLSNRQDQFGVYTFVNAATAANNRIAINGGTRTLATSTAAAGYNTTSNQPVYLNQRESGQPYTGGYDLGELISYNSELTSQQSETIEGYLAWKWGLQADLCGTHFHRFRPPLTVSFSPPLVSNCVMWLDGADPANVRTAGGKVWAWMDKSGNNRHAQQNTDANRPTYTTSPPNSSYLTFASASSTFLDICDAANIAVGRSFSVFVAEQRVSTKSTPNYFIAGSGSTTNSNLVIGYLNDTVALVAFYGNDIAIGVTGYTGNPDVRIWSFTYTSGDRGLYFLSIGDPVVSDANATNLAAWAGASFGRFQGTSYYDGRLCEVIWYTGVPSSNVRQQIQGYLANKWNINYSNVSKRSPYIRVKP